MTQYVICALQMEGFHCWPEADGELAYLKNSHRHIFFITAEFPVRNANREIEIISQQNTHEGRMQLIGIIIGQYLLKACLALLDTPFFYFFTRNAERR